MGLKEALAAVDELNASLQIKWSLVWSYNLQSKPHDCGLVITFNLVRTKKRIFLFLLI